uniref:Zinc finger protein 526-like isoform X3 n=1 Tax=Petromyzon marinus TaxID=7757 RepID=A0AAJ7WUA6_PETMA|nr:zinc finger protein 526-like isoform X3 [Petromyzon marinus]
MACAATASWSEDFPAWLEAQGVNAEVAQAMDSELGIRDYGVLRACVRDGLVRAELLATARDRLPFGFYAVLRQVVKALQGAEHHDGETTAQSETAALRMDLVLSSLVDVLVALFGGLSRELSMSMEKLGSMDVAYVGGLSTPSNSGGTKYRPPEGDHLTAKLPNDYSNHNDTGEFTNAEDEPSSAVEEFEERDFNGESAGEVPEASTGGVATGIRSVETGVTDQRSWYGVKMEACEDERSAAAASAVVASAAHPPSRRGAEGGSRRLSWGEPGHQMDAAPLNAPAESAGGKGGGFGLARGEASSLEFAPGGDEGNHASWQGPADPVAVATTSTQHPGESVEGRSGRLPSSSSSSCSSFIQNTPMNRDLGTQRSQAADAVGGGTWWPPQSAREHGIPNPVAPLLHPPPRPPTPPPPVPSASSPPLPPLPGTWNPLGAQHECGVCGRAFAQHSCLRRHLRTHAGDRPHRCVACGKTFLQHYNLKVHWRTHTGEKPHACAVCGRAFRHSNGLKRHERTHREVQGRVAAS